MIQFKRGTKASWRLRNTILAPGQPGFDKTRNKIKVGDGKSGWNALKYASGLSEEEILDSEASAAIRNLLDNEDKTIFTYGDGVPNDSTIGQVYLQQYDTEPEVDYIVSSGVDGIWSFQKWYSGKARCTGILELTSIKVNNAFESGVLYYSNNAMQKVSYPFTFIKQPSETATLHNPSGSSLAWLATKEQNSASKSGVYTLISPDTQGSTNYKIALQVDGFWR